MNRIAIYAHFDPNGDLLPYSLHFLQQLHSLEFRTYFVSNSPLCPKDKQALAPFADEIIERENIGYDFAMWKQVLSKLRREPMVELLLANSSMIGPLTELATVWKRAEMWDCDFWGMSDNRAIFKHIQSYFMVFRRAVLESRAFWQFWEGVLPYVSKDQIIRSYEMGLTKWLEENSFRWEVIARQEDVCMEYKRRRRTIFVKLRERLTGNYIPGYNTTLYFPDLLLARGVPFVKASLLKEGNARVSPQLARKLILERVCEPSWVGEQNVSVS